MKELVNIGVMMSPSLKKEFKMRCTMHDTTISDVLREAIEAWMLTHPTKTAKKDVF